MPGRARLLDELGHVGERRQRALERLVAGHAAQHADHLAQVLERGMRVRADHARRPRDLLLRGARG